MSAVNSLNWCQPTNLSVQYLSPEDTHVFCEILFLSMSWFYTSYNEQSLKYTI
jgi:hypothetical protein